MVENLRFVGALLALAVGLFFAGLWVLSFVVIVYAIAFLLMLSDRCITVSRGLR